MKKLIILISFIAFKTNAFSKEYANCPPDSLALIMYNINLNQFKNQPIDSFIAHIPPTFTSMKVYGGGRIEKADQIIISYPNGIDCYIYIKEFTHMDPYTHFNAIPTTNWDINLARKEKVWFIQIWNNTICKNGCNDKRVY
jgi:hypothetical protein